MSFTNAGNTTDSTLTRDGKTSVTSCHKLDRTTGRQPPPFSSDLSPSRIAATQMDRHGVYSLGLHPPYATSIPLVPHRRRRRVPPRSFHPCTTTSLDAATKGTQERMPPQFSSGTLFPHPRRGRYSPCLRCGGATRQHSPACQAEHLPHAAQKTGYACVTAGVGDIAKPHFA